MNDDEKPEKGNKVISAAILKNHELTDEERAALLEKVTKKLEGKMIKMTEEEMDEFFDTRGF